MKHVLIVGCGITGAVIARELANNGYKVKIIDKRNHIGGNMYDFVDEYGILIQRYGPHIFHTKKKELFDYVSQYERWDGYKLMCGAEINGICTPTPFNFKTIDQFFSESDAEKIKKEIGITFPNKNTVTVVEALNSGNKIIQDYAQFLFDNDYSLYTAKQWGISPSKIDSSILKRVPLCLNYEEGYFDDEYQVMPHTSFTKFFENLLNHQNIDIELGVNALSILTIKDDKIFIKGEISDCLTVYTGPIDELFGNLFGKLPYRSLRFDFRHEDVGQIQSYPVVAYPQEEGYTRITEFNKLPKQQCRGTTYAVEYPLQYENGSDAEPYYPILTEESKKIYGRYENKAKTIKNLLVCGRLGSFKYYNMDQALEEALNVVQYIIELGK